jgi:N-acetylmuramic acid 6-phosphate etherase
MASIKETRSTEMESKYTALEKMPIRKLLISINKEDKSVPYSVSKCIPAIEKLINKISIQMKRGGRLFYIGAGTSGRLGIVDASECPPTYGIEHGKVIGLIAGGDKAIRKAVEFAEDDLKQGWKDLKKHNITKKDILIGIAASGSTPYVVGALEKAQLKGITTACITCNLNTDVAKYSHYPIEIIVGPEFVSGSTRMKAGTAQKLVLNMISTAVMIQLGRVRGNRMVDMQLSNNKLIDRGTKMVMSGTGLKYSEAGKLLKKHGSVRKAMENYLNKKK